MTPARVFAALALAACAASASDGTAAGAGDAWSAISERIFLPGGAHVQGFGAVAIHDVFTVPAALTCP